MEEVENWDWSCFGAAAAVLVRLGRTGWFVADDAIEALIRCKAREKGVRIANMVTVEVRVERF